MVLNNKIKQLRKDRNVTQQELAEYLGIERTSLSKIENMHYNPGPKLMKEVSDFFKLPIGDIFFNPNVLFDNTNEHHNYSSQ